MDVGAQLREARQRRAMTLDDLTASTKLSKHTLADIEHNRFSCLPGGILTKGHLRAYAIAVGLDPEHIVRDYLDQCFGESVEELPIVRHHSVESDPRTGQYLLVPTVVIALGLAWYATTRSDADRSTAPEVDTETARATADVDDAKEIDVIAPAVPAHETSEMQIDIQPTGPCWVSATTDSHVLLSRLLKVGERVSVSTEKELVLRIGDPGTFVYWLNGTPGRTLGPAGEPITVRIAADNYELFLQ